MIEIQKNYSENQKINTKLVKKAIILTLVRLEKQEVDITLRLTGDTEMRQFNHTFRGISESTDVLSFNQNALDPETNRLYLGDIIISIDRARKQAQEQGHSIDVEIAFLAIHGTLHLLGFDHGEPKEKREMWEMQDKILHHLNNKIGEVVE